MQLQSRSQNYVHEKQVMLTRNEHDASHHHSTSLMISMGTSAGTGAASTTIGNISETATAESGGSTTARGLPGRAAVEALGAPRVNFSVGRGADGGDVALGSITIGIVKGEAEVVVATARLGMEGTKPGPEDSTPGTPALNSAHRGQSFRDVFM